jgi:hypothetical protein
MLSIRLAVVAAAVLGLAGCQTMGALTVQNYTSKSGSRVVAGQAAPKEEYKCQKVSQEKYDWGLKGNLDKAAAARRVTDAAVEDAPARGANYAYVMTPAEIGVGAINVNAFSNAQVAFYRCAELPGMLGR